MDDIIPGMGSPTTGVIPQTAPTNAPNIGNVLTQAGVTNPAAPNANIIAQILSQLTRKTNAMPGANRPLPQRQYPEIQDSTTGREFRAVGSNKRSAIGDIFHNVGSMVKTARQNKEAQESRTLSVDLERIMIASQDLPDPTGKVPATPEQQKNQQIINDVLSDPKKRKQVEKALDISFMGEDKRDKVSKSAMDSALKKVQSMQQPMSEQIPGVGGTPTSVGGPGQVPSQQQGGGAGVQVPAQQRQMPQQQQNQQRPDYASQLMKQLPKTMDKVPPAILEQMIKSETELTKESMKNKTDLEIQKMIANSKSAEDLAKIKVATINAKGRNYWSDAYVKAADLRSSRDLQSAKYKVDHDPRLKLSDTLDKQMKRLDSEASTADKIVKDLEKQWKSAQEKGMDSRTVQDIGIKLYKARQTLTNILNEKHKINTQGTSNIKDIQSGGTSTGDRSSTEFNADDFVKSYDDFKAVTGGEE